MAVKTSTHIPLSEDAALVTALAGTAMAFSHSAEDEAERWLRALRLQGKVGAATMSPPPSGSERWSGRSTKRSATRRSATPTASAPPTC